MTLVEAIFIVGIVPAGVTLPALAMSSREPAILPFALLMLALGIAGCAAAAVLQVRAAAGTGRRFDAEPDGAK